MKKIVVMCILTAMCMMTFTACEKKDSGDTYKDETEKSTEDSTDKSTEDIVGISEAQDSSQQENDIEISLESLSQEEMKYFSDFIQDIENYGFVLSEYDSPDYIDFSQVFYNGAGCSESMTDEDIQAYLQVTGEEELYTDCVKISSDTMDAFLQRKLGVGIYDLKSDFCMTYVPETDAYYIQAGDTNYAAYVCVGGTKEGNVYTLQFEPDSNYSEWYMPCETVLEKTEDNEFHFVSNRYVSTSDD